MIVICILLTYLFQIMLARIVSRSNAVLKENSTIFNLCGCCFIPVGKHYSDNCCKLVSPVPLDIISP